MWSERPDLSRRELAPDGPTPQGDVVAPLLETTVPQSDVDPAGATGPEPSSRQHD
jgi:hypothetical protein